MLQEVRGLDCQNVQATTESMLDLDDFCGSLAKYNSTREYQTAASTKSYGDWLKFVLLFGYLTLQGSHQALAGTDFASGFQSIPYLGDFGDISTGFASVRRISLYLVQLAFYYGIKTHLIASSNITH